jgi:hypothetical protein
VEAVLAGMAISHSSLVGNLGQQLKRDDFSSNRHRASTSCWRMIFSDLASPAGSFKRE